MADPEAFNGFTHVPRHSSDLPSVNGELVENGTTRIRIDLNAIAEWQAAHDAGDLLYVAETPRAESASSE